MSRRVGSGCTSTRSTTFCPTSSQAGAGTADGSGDASKPSSEAALRLLPASGGTCGGDGTSDGAEGGRAVAAPAALVQAGSACIIAIGVLACVSWQAAKRSEGPGGELRSRPVAAACRRLEARTKVMPYLSKGWIASERVYTGNNGCATGLLSLADLAGLSSRL